jgi:hypothetical protein
MSQASVQADPDYILVCGLYRCPSHDYQLKSSFEEIMESFPDLLRTAELSRLGKDLTAAGLSREKQISARDGLGKQVQDVRSRINQLETEETQFRRSFQDATGPAQKTIDAERAALSILHREILTMGRAAISDKGLDARFADIPPPDLDPLQGGGGVSELLIWLESVGHRIASLQ